MDGFGVRPPSSRNRRDTALGSLLGGMLFSLSGPGFPVQFSLKDTDNCGQRVLGLSGILKGPEGLAILSSQCVSHRDYRNLGKTRQYRYSARDTSLGRNRLCEQFSTISFDLSHDKASCSGNPSRFLSRLSSKPIRWGTRFVIETFVASAGLFLIPFAVLGWPISTVTNGFSSWFSRAGALSIFNIVTLGTGTEQLPSNLWWAGYLAPFGTLALVAYGLIRKPQDTLRYALLSAAVFFTLRPWNSEQNLVIIFALFVLLRGDLPSRWLWIVPTCFAVANSALQAQLYLLMPWIVDYLSRFYAPFYTYLSWLKFFISLVWLIVLWLNVAPFAQKKEL